MASADSRFGNIDRFKLLVAILLLALIALRVWPTSGTPPAAGIGPGAPTSSPTVRAMETQAATPTAAAPLTVTMPAPATTTPSPPTATATSAPTNTPPPTLSSTPAATASETAAPITGTPEPGVLGRCRFGDPDAYGVDRGQTWLVDRCDTMAYIAQQTGIDLKALLAANPEVQDPYLIFPGQVITLPGR